MDSFTHLYNKLQSFSPLYSSLPHLHLLLVLFFSTSPAPALLSSLPYIFLTDSPLDRYLGCFHFLIIVNRAAMNTGVQVPLLEGVEYFGYMPRSSRAGVCGSCLQLFEKPPHWFPLGLPQFTVYIRIPFPHIFGLHRSHSDWHKMKS